MPYGLVCPQFGQASGIRCSGVHNLDRVAPLCAMVSQFWTHQHQESELARGEVKESLWRTRPGLGRPWPWCVPIVDTTGTEIAGHAKSVPWASMGMWHERCYCIMCAKGCGMDCAYCMFRATPVVRLCRMHIVCHIAPQHFPCHNPGQGRIFIFHFAAFFC